MITLVKSNRDLYPSFDFHLVKYTFSAVVFTLEFEVHLNNVVVYKLVTVSSVFLSKTRTLCRGILVEILKFVNMKENGFDMIQFNQLLISFRYNY